MIVKNLDAWAGLDFSHAYGAILDLPEAMALDRIAAGLAEAVEAAEPDAAEVDPAEPAPAPTRRKRAAKA